jgi:uncharacterized protein
MYITLQLLKYALLSLAILLAGTVMGQIVGIGVSKTLFDGSRAAIQVVPVHAAWLQVIMLTGPALCTATLTFLWIRYREQMPLVRLMPAAAAQGVWLAIGGMLMGGSMFMIATALAFNVGSIKFVEPHLGQSLVIPLITLLGWTLQAASEEYLFRGWLLQRLSSKLSVTWAIVWSALIFSLVHGVNPDTTLIAYINLWLAGVWFALLAIRSGSIVLPTFAHLGWNWIEGSGLGLWSKGDEPVGGSIMQLAFNAPGLLTGPGNGMNDGLALGIALLIFIAIEIVLMLRSRQVNSVIKINEKH